MATLILLVGTASEPLPAQPVHGDPEAPLSARVLGAEIRTRDAEELRYWILRELTDRYAAERGIEVTPAEIDAYVAGMEHIAERDRQEREARREAIEKRLVSATLSDDEHEALSAERDALNELLANLDEMAASRSAESEEDRAARREVAAAFVRQWKIDRALHQEYGGRIIFQQGGPEPLDAYRRFLEEAQAQGKFEILDKDLAAGFWRYYRTDAIHSFYPAGSEEEAKAFETPWWLNHPLADTP